MNYPLRTQRLTRAYAAVRCRLAYKPMRYILDPDPNDPVFLVQPGEEIIELPPDIQVVTESGEEVRAEGRFFRTVRTINPYHGILDIWDFSVIH